jgi:hypothetical protein
MATAERIVALAGVEEVDVMQRLTIQTQVTRTFSSTRVPAVFSGLGTIVGFFALTPRYCAFLWDENGGDGLICVFRNLVLGGNNLILEMLE